MGSRGPIPRHPNERRRRNLVPGAETAMALMSEVRVPPAPKGVHPAARRWYRSLAKSGQSQFYEPSDWGYARITAIVLSKFLEQGITPSGLAVVQSMMNGLLTTEASRRRVGLSIARPPAQDEDATAPTAIEYYRELLSTPTDEGRPREGGDAGPDRDGA